MSYTKELTVEFVIDRKMDVAHIAERGPAEQREQIPVRIELNPREPSVVDVLRVVTERDGNEEPCGSMTLGSYFTECLEESIKPARELELTHYVITLPWFVVIFVIGTGKVYHHVTATWNDRGPWPTHYEASGDWEIMDGASSIAAGMKDVYDLITTGEMVDDLAPHVAINLVSGVLMYLRKMRSPRSVLRKRLASSDEQVITQDRYEHKLGFQRLPRFKSIYESVTKEDLRRTVVLQPRLEFDEPEVTQAILDVTLPQVQFPAPGLPLMVLSYYPGINASQVQATLQEETKVVLRKMALAYNQADSQAVLATFMIESGFHRTYHEIYTKAYWQTHRQAVERLATLLNKPIGQLSQLEIDVIASQMPGIACKFIDMFARESLALQAWNS